MNNLKNLWEKFISLPAEMKMLFIALVFLILFISKFGLVSCKSKPTTLEKANIQFKIDSANASNTEQNIRQIKNRFSGPDSAPFTDSVLRSNGIHERK